MTPYIRSRFLLLAAFSALGLMLSGRPACAALTATITYAQTSPTAATLTASVTGGAAGDNYTYAFSKTAGPGTVGNLPFTTAATTATSGVTRNITVSVPSAAANDYTFQVIVTDMTAGTSNTKTTAATVEAPTVTLQTGIVRIGTQAGHNTTTVTASLKNQFGTALSYSDSEAVMWSVKNSPAGASVSPASGTVTNAATTATTLTATAAGSYIVVATTSLGAVDSASITADAPPTVTSLVASVAADGLSGTLTTTATTTMGPLTYAYTNTVFPAGHQITVSGTGATAPVTFTALGSYTFKVTVTDSLGQTTNATSNSVTVTQVLTTVAVTPSSPVPMVVAGATKQYTATGSDQFGAPMVTIPMFSWTVSSAGGGSVSMTGLYTAPTHIFNDATTNTESDTVTATSMGKSGTAPATVIPGPAHTITFQAFPLPVISGASNNLLLKVVDTNGNNVANGTTVILTLTNKPVGSSGITGPTTATTTNGVATFSGETITFGSLAAGDYSLQAASAPAPAATQTFTVYSAAPNKISLTGPSSVSTGPVSLDLAVEDANGNIVGNVHGGPNYGPAVVSFSATDPQATVPGSITFNQSNLNTYASVISVTFRTPVSQTVTASATGLTPGTYTATPTVSTASQFLVTITPPSALTGSQRTVTVTAEDQFSNIATNYTGTIHFTTDDPAPLGMTAGDVQLPPDYTFVSSDNGQHTFTNGVVLITAGTDSVTVTDTSTGASGIASAVVVAGMLNKFVVNAPGSVFATVPFTVTATATDVNGNPILSYSDPVTVTSSDPAAGVSLPSSVTFSNGTGVFSATLVTPGNQTITVTDSSTITVTGTSKAIAVADQAVTVAVAPSATPSPVTGTTTNLSVLGAYPGGESNLTYNWTVTSVPAAAATTVTYSINNSNAAKNTTAMFTAAGTYTFTVTISDHSGNDTTAALPVTVDQTPTTVAVSPTSATVSITGTATFTATVNDQFGTAISLPTISWTASRGSVTSGTVTGSETYTAPTRSGQDQVTATVTTSSGAQVSGSASVMVTPGSATQFTVNITPSPALTEKPLIVTVTAEDQYFNIATDYTKTIQFTTNDPAPQGPTTGNGTSPPGDVQLPPNYTFVAGDNGQKSFGATLITPGNESITVTDTMTPTISGSGVVHITNGGLDHIGITTTLPALAPPNQGYTATATQAFMVTISAFDAGNNVITSLDAPVTVAVALSTASNSPFINLKSSLVNGTVTLPVTINAFTETGTHDILTATVTASSSSSASKTLFPIIVTNPKPQITTASPATAASNIALTSPIVLSGSGFVGGPGFTNETILSQYDTKQGKYVPFPLSDYTVDTATETITILPGHTFSVQPGVVQLQVSNTTASGPALSTTFPFEVTGFLAQTTVVTVGDPNFTSFNIAGSGFTPNPGTNTFDQTLILTYQGAFASQTPVPLAAAVDSSALLTVTNPPNLPIPVPVAGPYSITATSATKSALAMQTLQVDPLPSSMDATRTTAGASFTPGLHMISVPFDYGSDVITDVFKLLDFSATDPSGATIVPTYAPVGPALRFAVWNPGNTMPAYDVTSAGGKTLADNLTLGRGYWVRFPATGGITGIISAEAGVIQRGTVALKAAGYQQNTGQYTIELAQGWNMIGDPFTNKVQLANFQVALTTAPASVVSLVDGDAQGIASDTLYTYNSGTGLYDSVTPGNSGSLAPYAGYWILAFKACTLYVSSN